MAVYLGSTPISQSYLRGSLVTSIIPPSTGGGSVTQTVLRRESDGTVTVISLAKPFTPILTRQSDGTITVGA